MPNFLSQLTKSEQARLFEELNYMNLEEIRGFCSKRGIPYRIVAEHSNGKVKATKDTDRKPIVVARIRRYLTTGRVGQPTRIAAKIVREENPPARIGPRDRLYYRWYAKEFEGVMRLLRKLTAGRFRDGAVARVVAMEFWTRGEAPTFGDFARAWTKTKAGQHRLLTAEYAYLTDLKHQRAGVDWKALRKAKAKSALATLARIAGVLAATLVAGCTSSVPAAPPAAPIATRVVDIAAPDGVTLKATLFTAAAPGPAVLLLHQCDDRRTVWDPLGQRLAAAGITALAVDYRGFGESGGAPFDSLANDQKAAVIANAWPGDFDAALAFLARLSGVDEARIGAAGGSCGVNNVIRLAQRHANVKALALLAGPADRDARAFVEAAGAPPVFTAAAADDKYGDFVLVARWQFGLSPRKQSRFAQYPDGGHAAVVFGAHPDLADQIAQWFAAVLNSKPASLPSTNGVPMSADVLQGLKAIERPGGASATLPRLPEYVVNWLGYEHLGMNDTATGLEIMRLNAASYPTSANAQDSLSDAYIAAGDTSSALAAAKRALELLAIEPNASARNKDVIRAAAEKKIATLSSR